MLHMVKWTTSCKGCTGGARIFYDWHNAQQWARGADDEFPRCAPHEVIEWKGDVPDAM